MTVKKLTDTEINPQSLNDTLNKAIITSKSRAKKAPKLTDMTVDDLKILIGEIVAAELQKWSNQLAITIRACL